MADGTEKIEEEVKTEREEIFSKSVRAGKRTYFFDVKTTRRNDYYLTLTESKKRFNRDGRFYFEKHKIFLYKEDFDKFVDGLSEAIEYIKANAPEILEPEEALESTPVSGETSSEEKAQQPEAAETPETEATETTVSDETEAADSDESDAADSDETDAAESDESAETTVEDEVGEPITEDFSNVEFEDLEDTKKS